MDQDGGRQQFTCVSLSQYGRREPFLDLETSDGILSSLNEEASRTYPGNRIHED